MSRVERLPAIVPGETLPAIHHETVSQALRVRSKQGSLYRAPFRFTESVRWPNRGNSNIGLSPNGQSTGFTSSLPDAVLSSNSDTSLRLQGMGEMGPCSWLSLYQWLYGMTTVRSKSGINMQRNSGCGDHGAVLRLRVAAFKIPAARFSKKRLLDDGDSRRTSASSDVRMNCSGS